MAQIKFLWQPIFKKKILIRKHYIWNLILNLLDKLLLFKINNTTDRTTPRAFILICDQREREQVANENRKWKQRRSGKTWLTNQRTKFAEP